MEVEWNEDDDNLTPEQINQITEMMKGIEAIAMQAREPIDPKVEVILEIAHSLLGEQIAMDKMYTWRPKATEDDRFSGTKPNEQMPTNDELREMMGDDV